jgi:formate hydrogenlyase subunit 3/multisubunit Na+/H+ antiporter MnhD subunit
MGPIVIFGMYVKDMAEIATILGTGRELSQTGDTIVTISAFLALILCICVLIDLIRILTGSFFEDSNSNDDVRAKDEDSRNNAILFPLIILLLITVITVILMSATT